MMLSVSLLPVQSASVHVVLWLVGIRMPPHIKGRWCCLAPEKFKRLREQEQCGKKECSEWWKILTQRQSYTEKKTSWSIMKKKMNESCSLTTSCHLPPLPCSSLCDPLKPHLKWTSRLTRYTDTTKWLTKHWCDCWHHSVTMDTHNRTFLSVLLHVNSTWA